MFLASCVQYPTETRQVSDLRPTISFAHGESEGAARVILDGLDVGSVSDFTTGRNALKILSGTHLLTIKLSEKVLLEEKFYVADGVHKNFSFR
jgi:hypothetical protein